MSSPCRLALGLLWILIFFPSQAGAGTSSASVAAGDLRPLANIDGFRSARFGMAEGDVRRAIDRDFALKEDRIRVDLHPVEKTTILTVTVDNLLPDTPSAVVSYVFGFHSRKLIQVGVLWAAGSPDGLTEAAQTLQNYFGHLQFQDGKSGVGGTLADGSRVVFRGVDRNGHVVLVNFRTPPDPKASGALHILQVTYAERVDSPDVFILEPGKF